MNLNLRLLQTGLQLFSKMALCAILFFSNNPRSSAAQSEYLLKLGQLADRLHLSIVIEHEVFPVQGRCGVIEALNPDSSDLAIYIPLFVGEFSQYSPEIISQSGLKKIVFCRNLKFDGQTAAGLADHDNQTLYFDTGICNNFPANLLRQAIHHEFFHIMDFKDDCTYDDPLWSSLNEPEFKYGTGGLDAKKSATMFMMNYALVGFLNRYSMSAVEEDRAEMFANMMIDYGRVKERTEWDDPILEAKFLQTKVFLHKFCPSFNDAFWIRISKRIAK